MESVGHGAPVRRMPESMILLFVEAVTELLEK